MPTDLVEHQSSISVRGAREHNLQNITVNLPRNKLVVITGLSGSGKSSLAFDTIYAEGQRRYVESLSAYARQFLELMQKPEVESIDGLSPAISIEQKTTSKNPRSTVGTVTEIHDYMRLLWARIGVPYSPATGLPITAQTVTQMVDRIMAMGDGIRLYILAPIVRGRKGEYRKDLSDLQKAGFQRVKVDGTHYEIDGVPTLNKKLKHNIEVVVDRVIIRDGLQSRLADSLETALSFTDGIAFTENADTEERIVLSSKFACPVSGFTIDEIEPRLFSFNNPFGACPSCDGLGVRMHFDPDLVIPNKTLSLSGGAIVPWSNTSPPSHYYLQALRGIVQFCQSSHPSATLDTPWKKLPKKVRDAILYGTGNESILIKFSDGKRKFETEKPFEGVMNNLARRWRDTDSTWIRDELSKYQTSQVCDVCNGQRLRAESLAVKINDKNVSEVSELSIAAAHDWFSKLKERLSRKEVEIAKRILREIDERLGFLNNVGLEYLTLARNAGTLSGGESQRIRLASQIGSGLTGVLYVLDEPSIGLHQRDNARLLETLRHLRDIGNTVIVVEHDEEAIRAADHLLDMGPGAGIHGGKIVAEGDLEEIMRSDVSLTAAYLTGKLKIPVPSKRRKGNGKSIIVKGAEVNNLKSLDATFPLGVFTCVTGVSGGGKSSLVLETLYKALAKTLHGARAIPGQYKKIDGLHHIDKIVDIDQSPIGRTPRSNPATYTGAFTPIRDWFSELPEAKSRGYKPGRFSFNVKGGRCEACRGDGLIKIEMHFLPDIYVTCDVCSGRRYNRETLDIKFKGKSIADVLDMTVEEGVIFFKAVPAIRDKMRLLQQVGLDYIHLGQQATTLSGGEAQRVKLAKELSKRATGRTLYILDEPTTGLHFEDVRKLLEVLHHLVEAGNTIIVIEHNLEVIKTADYIIDIGPEGGDGGGEIIASGNPETVSRIKDSYTGQYLKAVLAVERKE
ncbi:MAG: excinuclease ABC subunit UvrA [Rhodospirillaceae bacterium]